MTMRVLLIGDDARRAAALRSTLDRRAIVMDWAIPDPEVPARAKSYDVVLLDIGVPDVEGFELCRAIRRTSAAALVVFSGPAGVNDRARALRSGADDHLVKPFPVDELVIRIRAALRRGRSERPSPVRGIRLGELDIDVAGSRVSFGETPVRLSGKEFRLLVSLASARGGVRTREQLAVELWGAASPGTDRRLDGHVASLRGKLGRPAAVVTVHGVGYRLNAWASCSPGAEQPASP